MDVIVFQLQILYHSDSNAIVNVYHNIVIDFDIPATFLFPSYFNYLGTTPVSCLYFTLNPNADQY